MVKRCSIDHLKVQNHLILENIGRLRYLKHRSYDLKCCTMTNYLCLIRPSASSNWLNAHILQFFKRRQITTLRYAIPCGLMNSLLCKITTSERKLSEKKKFEQQYLAFTRIFYIYSILFQQIFHFQYRTFIYIFRSHFLTNFVLQNNYNHNKKNNHE